MNDKLILQLMDFYKARGIDLHYLLDDKLFDSLPIDRKIEFVRTHAQELLDGTSTGLSKLDLAKARSNLKSSVLLGGATGLLASVGASRALGKPFGAGAAAALAPLLIGVTSGAGFGVIRTGLDEYQNYQKRKSMHQAFQNVVNNPSDQNAFYAVVQRNLQRSKVEGDNHIIEDHLKGHLGKFWNNIKDGAESNTRLAYGIKD